MTVVELKRPPEPAPGASASAPLPERADTPCVAVCSTTFDEICRGCGRTVVEVAHWVSMTPEHKEAVWVRILAQGYPRRN
jgi:predicted Fe-S protein YdhL (DUF1289 family)